MAVSRNVENAPTVVPCFHGDTDDEPVDFTQLARAVPVWGVQNMLANPSMYYLGFLMDMSWNDHTWIGV